MEITRLATDDDAVSPVIGVILMVAVTVILAAVIGAFVLGMSNTTETAPQVSWETDAADTNDNGTVDEVTFVHQSGDPIQQDQVRVTIPGDSEQLGSSGQITAGDTITVDLDDSSASSGGDTLRVVWELEGTDQSTVIVQYRFRGEYGGGIDGVSM